MREGALHRRGGSVMLVLLLCCVVKLAMEFKLQNLNDNAPLTSEPFALVTPDQGDSGGS